MDMIEILAFTLPMVPGILIAAIARLHLRRLAGAAFLSDELAAVAERGLPLLDGLRAKAHDSGGWRRRVIGRICGPLEEGESLATAFERTGLFPRSCVAMVAAGERRGVLPALLPKLAAYQRSQVGLVRRGLVGLVYPAATAYVMYVAFLALGVFAIPQFQAMFTEAGVMLPGLTRFVFACRSGIIALLVLSCLVSCVALALSWGTATRGRARVLAERLVPFVPFYRGYAQRVGLARLAQMMHVFLAVDEPLPEALAAAEGSLPGPLSEDIRTARVNVQGGQLLAEALAEADLVTPTFRWLVAVGERTNRLMDAFGHLADVYIAESAQTLDSMARAACPIAIVLLGALDGLIVLATFLPLVRLPALVG